MEVSEVANLDLEFKRYLQLLRPYLGQLVDENVIAICDVWIQRLTNCKNNEKILRNQYLFRLCYQLAKGILEPPFTSKPPEKLHPLSDDVSSEEFSTEIECPDINSDKHETKILFNGKKVIVSDSDYLSQEDDKTWSESIKYSETHEEQETCGPSYNQTILFNQYPKMIEKDIQRQQVEGYECRANNLVLKLREIKMQNMLLQKELLASKKESKSQGNIARQDYNIKIDNASSALFLKNGSSATLKSLKCQLQDIQDSRNILIDTISHLRDQLDNLNEIKNNQIGDIEAKYKLDLIKVRTDAREETKTIYEKKFEELKRTYEDTFIKIQENAKNEIKAITESTDEIIAEKNKLLEAKTKEIDKLKYEIETEKMNVKSMLNNIVKKGPKDTSHEGLRLKNQLLEKRLNKLDRSKLKFAMIYEAKVAQLQREKHLAECSLQLQLVRQRTQVVSELTDENQTELNTSLDKLEKKYKEIVANVQAVAIQRRMQDRKALDSLIQTVCGIDDPNRSPYFNPIRHNQTFETESSSMARSNKVLSNKSYGEENLGPGFCLDGERMSELFGKIYVPQRDNGKEETK